MNGKKLFWFISIVAVIFVGVVWSSPYFMNKVKLGLDLKGGFETLYVASAIDEGGVVTKEALQETAKSLLSHWMLTLVCLQYQSCYSSYQKSHSRRWRSFPLLHYLLDLA